MSVRKLGKGRILGNRENLASTASVSDHGLSGYNSSAENEVHLLETPTLVEYDQDLSSVVSVRTRNTPPITAEITNLNCPICNEEMMTLLQLNRHLDDNHQELPEGQQDEVKTWFDKQVVKAKKFPPFAVINQKLKGLDVFEPNGLPIVSSYNLSTHPGTHLTSSDTSRIDPGEIVTKAHWQRSGYNDQCTEPACGKRLGAVNGNVNCRKCGRLFCENHTIYQIKLSRSAQHDPLRGIWCRVCETCFKSRKEYNDHNGFERDLTDDFMASRRKFVYKMYLETSRLEKRLTKLTQLLANPPEDIHGNGTLVIPLGGQKNQRKILEQSVVPWEEDATVSRCPLCHQEFGSWSFRRHHCRLCGQVVCADLTTGCSSEISLNVAVKKGLSDLTLEIRVCRNCQSIVFRKKDFEAEASHKPPDQRAYENLVQFEMGIHMLLPKFQRLIIALQDPETPPSKEQLNEATKVRKRLIDSFGKYDTAARRIRDLPSKSPTQERLQKAIYQQSANFLNIYMLPLKSLPKILKHASPNGIVSANKTASLAAIKRNEIDTPSQVSSSSAPSVIEAEERELTEQLIVLEEQRFMLSEMVTAARKSRRLDELAALQENKAELGKECNRLRDELSQLEGRSNYGE